MLQYSIRLANVVHVKKKKWANPGLHLLRDLNKTCRKDEFLAPHMELHINATADYEVLSFMDEYLT